MPDILIVANWTRLQDKLKPQFILSIDNHLLKSQRKPVLFVIAITYCFNLVQILQIIGDLHLH